PDVGRRAHDGDARRLHGLHLLLGRALAPGDDGPRVSHAPPRGRGLAGDESDHRLPDVLPDVGRRLFLLAAPDLTDHHDALRSLARVQERHGLRVVRADDGIAADADAGGLADAERGELRDRLVGQGPAAAHDTDAPALVDVAGHDADLALL